MKVDYKLLLKKYMEEVFFNEGVTFVDSCFYKKPDGSPQTKFNQAEKEALLRIEKEADL